MPFPGREKITTKKLTTKAADSFTLLSNWNDVERPKRLSRSQRLCISISIQLFCLVSNITGATKQGNWALTGDSLGLVKVSRRGLNLLGIPDAIEAKANSRQVVRIEERLQCTRKMLILDEQLERPQKPTHKVRFPAAPLTWPDQQSGITQPWIMKTVWEGK